jgi:tetratricopeptide (TPR) repeat protein
MKKNTKRVAFTVLTGSLFLFFILSCTTVSFDKEIVQFFSNVRPQPGNPDSHYLLACYYQERGRHKEAIEEFRKTALINPNHVKTYNGMGISYDLLGDFQKAIESYKTALKLNPDLDYVHNNLGYSYLLQGKFDEAIVAFNQAISLNDLNKQTHNNLGLAYAETGQFDLAMAEFKKAGDEVKAHYNMAQVYLKKGLYNEAKSHYTNALNLNPSLTMVRTGLEAAHVLARIFLPIPVKTEPKDWIIPPSTPLMVEIVKEELNDPPTYESHSNQELRGTDQLIIVATKEINPIQTASDQSVTGELKNQENSAPDQRMEPKQPNSFREVGVEISNGNGVNRMARRVGNYLKEKGFNVVRLTNANNFSYSETQIYFHKGHGDDARQLAEQIISKLENMKELKQLDRPNIKIKVIIGRDLISKNKSFGDQKS